MKDQQTFDCSFSLVDFRPIVHWLLFEVDSKSNKAQYSNELRRRVTVQKAHSYRSFW